MELLKQLPFTSACYCLWSVFISCFCGKPQYLFIRVYFIRFQRPRGLNRGSAASCCWDCGFESLREMNVCCECCVLSPVREHSCAGLWCVTCDLETSRIKRLCSALGRRAFVKRKHNLHIHYNIYHYPSDCEPHVLVKPLLRIYLNKI
jgi:hypothetical protein